MICISSKNECSIRFTDERIKHISENHPETKECILWIVETIEEPNIILEGEYGELIALRFYSKTPVSANKYLAVVYKEMANIDGFVITAYFCTKYNNSRKVIWKH